MQNEFSSITNVKQRMSEVFRESLFSSARDIILPFIFQTHALAGWSREETATKNGRSVSWLSRAKVARKTSMHMDCTHFGAC